MLKKLKLFLPLFLIGLFVSIGSVSAENWQYQKMYLTSHHFMNFTNDRGEVGRANLHIIEDLDTASSNTAGDGVIAYAYCADVDTGGYQGTYVKSLITNDSYNGNGARMRAILSSSYPFITINEMKALYMEQMGAESYNSNNIADLTYQEAIYVTQAAVWTLSNPNRAPFTYAGNMDDSEMLVLHHNRLNIKCDWTNSDPSAPNYCYPNIESTKYETNETVVNKRVSAMVDWLLSMDGSELGDNGNISVNVISKNIKYDEVMGENIATVSFKIDSKDLTMINSLATLNIEITDQDGNDIEFTEKDGIYSFKELYPGNQNDLKFNIKVKYVSRYASKAYLYKSSGNQDLVSAEKYEVSSDASATVEISKKSGDVEISKIAATDGKELPGATLQLHDSNGNLIDEWVSTDKVHVVKGLNPGTYTLTEIIAPEGYVTATTITFEVKENEVTKVEMIDEVTKVMISKKDFTTEKEVVGAKIQIRDLNGNVIHEWVSTNEPHYIEKLPVGKYVLVETVYPNGYQENMIVDGIVTTEYEFEVENTGEIQTIDVYNRSNNKIENVPATGINKSMFLGLSIVTIGGSIVIISRRKKFN
ncbi:MAG: Cys-Gln thioester bond-forming surface protein [Bacilli bacterium]|nr:Cys-Gln thioester bond-forming surface protein [Bacilli bacterium]